MSLDVPALAADLAERLGIDTQPATDAVNAAGTYIANDTGVAFDDLPPDDVLLNPGVILLAARIVQDTPTPGGNLGQFDPTFDGILVPKYLYSHLDEYWRHLRVNWGIA